MLHPITFGAPQAQMLSKQRAPFSWGDALKQCREQAYAHTHRLSTYAHARLGLCVFSEFLHLIHPILVCIRTTYVSTRQIGIDFQMPCVFETSTCLFSSSEIMNCRLLK